MRTRLRRLTRSLASSLTSRLTGRFTGHLWPVLQQAAAAAVSWWIARIAFDHHLPLFAPIATLVALNTPLGGRGSNTVRVVLGAVVGVLIGQLAYTLLGAAALSVGVAVLCALLVALAVDGERITMAQAAVGAVIAVAAGQQAGTDRVFDAVLGGLVALFFSQFLFPAHPLALLRRAESTVLDGLSSLLARTVRCLDQPERVSRRQLVAELRPLYSPLKDLGRARDDTVAAARRTLHWRGRQGPISQEIAAAASLDLLAGSCLTLTRATLDATDGRALVPALRGLSDTLHTLSVAPGNPSVRRGTARSALGVVRDAPGHGSGTASGTAQALLWTSVRSVVRDILVFLGATDEDAERAVRERADDVPLGLPARLRRVAPRRRGCEHGGGGA